MAKHENDRQPMIEVQNLTKFYGSQAAIQDLSFTVQRGEIVGFIGPNGAGKSTTMRILAGFLSATEGTARVAGHDVSAESEEVRRRVGFMPENNPLHEDMRVREYLKFRARLKGLNREESRDRVGDVMEQLSLTDVQHRMIGALSKGYRQRVGLADALVHEPDLLILDEPTIGRDPHQIVAVRELIKTLADEGDERAQTILQALTMTGKFGDYVTSSMGPVSKAYEISTDEWHNALADVKMMMEMTKVIFMALQEASDVDISKYQGRTAWGLRKKKQGYHRSDK